MNFYELPILTSTNITQWDSGAPFTDNAFKIAWYDMYDLYVGTDSGVVYAARVGNDLYFISIGSGYKGYTWLTTTVYQPIEWTVASTDYSSIYCVRAMQLSALYQWSGNLVSFGSESEMLEMFYDTYVDTSSPNGIVVKIIASPDNPYLPGGDSESGGGDGDFTLENSPIPLPQTPTLNLTNTHFISAYSPTLANLQAFQNWLWQDNPFQSWRDILGNPYDYIVGLHAIPKTPRTGSNENPVLGNLTSPVTMPKIIGQYVKHDFGTVRFNEYSKSYLDYSPYTKVTLYLPYIGYVQLDVDFLNGQTVNIQYTIDCFTGGFVAFVIVGNKVYNTYSGVMGLHVPMTNQTYNNFIGGLIGIGGAVASMIASEGATAPFALPSIASQATNILKPTIEHGNNITGIPGVMGIQYPYFIIKRPMQSIPDNMETFTGFPANIKKTLSTCTGFTKVEYIHLENISATQTEKTEIEDLLKEGVIF